VKKNNIYKIWSQKLIKDLGKERFKELFSKSIEGIKINPFYSSAKESFFYPSPKWKILAEINHTSFKNSLNEINNLREYDIQNIAIFNIDINEARKLVSKTKNQINFFCFVKDNKIYKSTDSSPFLAILSHNCINVKTINLSKINVKKFKINIDSSPFKDLGCNIIQEVAFTLGMGNEYLNTYGKKIASFISFELGQGGDYFFEIAKIQVIRRLWHLITSHYDNEITDVVITAKPILRNKTIKNYNNNLIRTTSECMSAILGGCDYIKSQAYDYLFNDKNDFSENLMLKQLLIIKKETNIDKVDNICEGSYYISYLKENIMKESFNLFKKIEKKGGFFKYLSSGAIIREIEKNNKKDIGLYQTKNKILVGYNAYTDENFNKNTSIEKPNLLRNNFRIETF
tara:strand:- start:10413 stop:11612 length:1200 start_codon:yes stop_codon:yes gene_type:complete